MFTLHSLIDDKTTLGQQFELLKHLASYAAPFYQEDVYITFCLKKPNRSKLSLLFSLFRVKGYIAAPYVVVANYLQNITAQPSDIPYELTLLGGKYLETMMVEMCKN